MKNICVIAYVIIFLLLIFNSYQQVTGGDLSPLAFIQANDVAAAISSTVTP
jgi:hypothetical protein